MGRSNKALYGSPSPNSGTSFVGGVIQSVTVNKCIVLTEDGRQITVDWPRAENSISGAGRSIQPPEQGQSVLLQFGSGIPFIAQTVGMVSPLSAASRAFSVADVGQASSSLGSLGGMYQDMSPTDVLPGDKLWIGNQGQKVGILDGGAAIVAATPFCGIRALQKNDLLQIFGRNTRLETGFGTLRFWDIDGKRGIDLVGGFDQLTESGTGLENWTVQMSLGPNSQGIFDFGLYDRAGDALYQHTIDGGGNKIETIAGSYVRSVSGISAERLDGMRSVVVDSGDDNLTVGGSWNRTISGEATLSSSGKMDLLSSADTFISSRRDLTLSTGRNATWNVGGDLFTGTPKSVAATWNISNGSFLLDVGNPKNMDLQKTKSGITAQTWLGDITLQSMLTGKIILNTTIPSSVLLGATAGVAPYSAVIYEQLQTFLTTFINSLMVYLTAHTHTSLAAPTSPPTGVPIIPSAAALTPLLAQMMLFKSMKVKLGG